MCRLAVADGTRAMVASPHMFNDMFDVAPGDILLGVSRLRERLRAEGIPLVVVPGADVRVVPGLDRLIRNGLAMTLGNNGRYIMIEFPQHILPHGLPDILFSIQLTGTIPIITHPERNLEVQADPLVMARFVEAGNLVQLTAASVVGWFGEAARDCAHTLLAARLAHLIASDAHSSNKRPPGLSKAFALMEELLPTEEVEEIFVHRPLSVLAGEHVDLPEPTRVTPRKRGPLWRALVGV